jgi:hypothetical protein
MNPGDPQSRDWRAQAPSRTAYSREWRGSGRTPSRYSRKFLLRLTAIALTIVVAVIVVLLVPWSGPVRPLHVVSFGIGAYGGRAQPQGNMPLNPFGEQDAKSFRVLNERAPQQFPSVKSEDNALTGAQFLTFLRAECESPELANRNLLLFCTLHGVVQSNGDVELFAIDATPTSSGAMVPLSSVLAILRDSRASRVLLALDTFRLESDWRLGILVNEIAAQLEADQPKAGSNSGGHRSGKVTLVLAANSGERSWYGDQGSIFAEALRDGLLGEADHASGSAGGTTANGDGRVSLLELTGYVRTTVANWSKRHRGAPQSVSVLGNADDFVLAHVTPPAPPVAEKKETPPEPPAKDEKKAAEAPKETAPKGEATAVAPAEKPKPPPVPPEERLRQLWSKQDELRNARGDGRIIACRQMPFAARSFSARLVQAESLRHGGFPELLPDILDQATKQLQRIAQGDDELSRLIPDEPGRQSAAVLGWNSARIDAAKLTAADQALQALLVPPPKAAPTPMPMPAPPAAAPAIPASAVIEAWFVQQLPDSAMRDRLRATLTALEKGGHWPQTPDCLLIRNVLQLEGPDADLAVEATQRILGLRRELRSIVLRQPNSYAALQALVAEALRDLTAAERWLLEAGPRQPEVRSWLDRAEAAVVQARRAGQRHGDLVGLWSDLLAELPAVAAWVAARASDEEQRPVAWNDIRRVAEIWSQNSDASLDPMRLQETWPDKPARLTNLERKLLVLFADAQRLQAAIRAKDSTGADLDLATVSRHRRDLWKEVEEAVPQLGTRSRPTPSEWWDSDRLVRAPFLPAEDRAALEKLLYSDPSHAGVARDVNADALWQGFWAIATLDLMQAGSPTGLWKSWDRLAELTQTTQPDLVARRAELGRSIRDVWTELQNRSESLNSRGLADLQLAAAVLDPHLLPRRDPDDELRQSASRSFGDWLIVFAADWRGRAADPQGSDYQRLAERAETLAAQLSAHEKSTPTKPGMLQVQGGRFDASRHSRLEASAAADDRDGLQLLLVPAPVRVNRGGKVSRLSQTQAIPLPENGQLNVDLELEDQIVAPEKMVIALAAADGFPLQFRTIQLTPPFDPSQWRIEFVDVESQTPLEASPLAGVNGVKLFFAPLAEIAVQARLIRPSQDTTPAVRIKLLQITGGEPIVLRDGLDVKLTGPQTPIVFDLPVVPEKTEGTAAAPPPSPAAVQADLARGWIFEIVPEGGDPFRYVVKPAFWSAAKFIDDPQPALQDGRFVLGLQRKAAQSALLPPKIEVALDPSDAVARVLIDPTLRGPLEPGQNSTLGFTLPEDWRAQAARSEWKVALGVAGLPHAYRWRIRETGNVDPLGGQPEQLEVRLLMPRNDKGAPVRDVPVLESGKDPLRIQLQVFADTLDRIDDPQDWRLVYRVVRITDDKPQATPFGHEWPLLSSVERHVELMGVKAGAWKFRTSARDYEHEFSPDDLRGLLGRFTVQAELRRGGRREPLAQQSLVFALDNDAPPKLESKFLAAESKGCRVRLSALDAESGIRRVTVGIDKNGDKQLAEDEIFETRGYPLFRENHPTWDTMIPWSKFPPLEKTTTTYTLLVQCQNGLGITGSQNVTVQYNPPKAATVGTLVIDMKMSGAAKATIELKGPQPKTVSASSSPVSIGDLPPGTYQIEVSVLDVVVGSRKSGKASADVKAGATTNVNIPLSASK